MSEAMLGWEKHVFAAQLRDGESVSHDVYARGGGPPIVLIQELPGIGPETLALAERLEASGFRVVLPHLFGPLGRTSFLGNTVRAFCMRRELHLFAKGDSSPVVDWLRALCRDERERNRVEGVGVIGMCLTGNFAISLMADENVLGAVASQPSLPFFGADALHMSETEVDSARARLDRHGPMLAMRFEGDPICSARKFEAIDHAFNDDRDRIRLKTLPGKGHSILTLHFVDEVGHPTREALDEVIDYFRGALGTPQAEEA